MASPYSIVTPGGLPEHRTSTCAAEGATLDAVSRQQRRRSRDQSSHCMAGRAMQWLLVRVRVITLTQTSCVIVRSASEVHNSAESWLRRLAEKACCQGMARAARVIEPCASGVVLDTCHRLQTAGTTPLRSRRPTAAPQATRREEPETTLRHVRDTCVFAESLPRLAVSSLSPLRQYTPSSAACHPSSAAMRWWRVSDSLICYCNCTSENFHRLQPPLI